MNNKIVNQIVWKISSALSFCAFLYADLYLHDDIRAGTTLIISVLCFGIDSIIEEINKKE